MRRTVSAALEDGAREVEVVDKGSCGTRALSLSLRALQLAHVEEGNEVVLLAA